MRRRKPFLALHLTTMFAALIATSGAQAVETVIPQSALVPSTN